MAWKIDDDVWIERDELGFARHLRHVQSPFSVAGVNDPYKLAVAYLKVVADQLGITAAQADYLGSTIPANSSSDGEGPISTAPGAQLRWWRRRSLRNETTVLVIQQTHDVPFRLTLPSPMQDITSLVLNVFGAALRVVLHRQGDGRLVVTGANSTLQHDFNFAHAAALASSSRRVAAIAGKKAKGKMPGIGPEGQGIITMQLGLTLLFNALADFEPKTETLPSEYNFWIYRYEAVEDDPSAARRAGLVRLHRRQPSELVPNSDYPVMIMRHEPFGAGDEFRVGLDSPPVDIVSRLPDYTVLAAIPLMAGARPAARRPRPVRGLVFLTDPISATGFDLPATPRRDRTLRPNRPSRELDRARTTVHLHRLDPPAGMPARQKLRGSNVVVVDPGEVDIGSIGVKPPSEAPGRDFSYHARTNDFAAVNAYYHLDSMLHRLELFGLPFAAYAPAFNPKLEVIHRAAIRPGPCGDGRCINAQVRIRPGETPASGRPDPVKKLHTLEFRFALADLPPTPEVDPLGVACDVRWVWHEFGHALIAGATGDLELPFAHSVGDALAAINCDPISILARPEWARFDVRGVTFPWVNLPTRRHDREAAQGWTWTGRLGQAAGYHQDMGDVAGYHREQVLSSTLFRLYRAIGGDAVRSGAPDAERRQRAADYVTYLIARALGSLGPASAVPAADASVFASALMDADRGTLLFDYPGLPPDLVSQRRVGGTVHKVVRWAFEKQGLYGRDEITSHGSGAPEPVDVYVDDGRQGEYPFAVRWTATPQALWLRHRPDGHQRHRPPRHNADNFIYLRVWNRGYETAHGVRATVRVARVAPNLGWPDTARWRDVLPVDPATAVGDVGANDQIVLGPFKWKPTARGEYTILAEVDVAGDRSNVNVSTGLPCALPTSQPTPLGALVPYDNNLGAAMWTVA